MNKTIQAKHITDAQMLQVVKEEQKKTRSNWAFRSDVAARLSQFPPKVVLAKLRSMVSRGILTGCCCGCRGDFEVLDESKARQ